MREGIVTSNGALSHWVNRSLVFFTPRAEYLSSGEDRAYSLPVSHTFQAEIGVGR